MPSSADFVFDFQNNTLWDTHKHALLTLRELFCMELAAACHNKDDNYGVLRMGISTETFGKLPRLHAKNETSGIPKKYNASLTARPHQ